MLRNTAVVRSFPTRAGSHIHGFRDLIRDVFHTLWAHKLRTALTMFGIAWGVVSIVLMVAAGEGLRVGQAKVSQKFGRDLMIVFAGRTSLQAGGARAGRRSSIWTPTFPTVQAESPDCEWVLPELETSSARIHSNYNAGAQTIAGSYPPFRDMRSIEVAEGRFYDWGDVKETRRVAFLGTEVKKQLFAGRNAIGENIYLNDIPYKVIGVMKAKNQDSSYDGFDVNKILCALPAMHERLPQQAAGDAARLDRLLVTPKSVDQHEACKNEIRAALGRLHNFDPHDKEAAPIWDTIEEAQAFKTMTDGMKYFLGAVGITTLFLGGLGVMNVMLVAVRERTREIGVRKAVGAQSRNILMQFFVETMIVVFVSGGLGMAIAFGFCALVNLLPMPQFFAGLLPTWQSGCSRSAAGNGGDACGDVSGAAGGLHRSHRSSALRGRRLMLAMMKEIMLESWTALPRSRTRSVLTMLGIVWGIVAVTLLIAYGSGFRTCWYRPSTPSARAPSSAGRSRPASSPAASAPARRSSSSRPISSRRNEATMVKHACLETVKRLPIAYGDRMVNTAMRGVCPEYGEMRNESSAEGRWINASDEARAAPRGLSRRPGERAVLQRTQRRRRNRADRRRALHRHRRHGPQDADHQLLHQRRPLGLHSFHRGRRYVEHALSAGDGVRRRWRRNSRRRPRRRCWPPSPSARGSRPPTRRPSRCSAARSFVPSSMA